MGAGRVANGTAHPMAVKRILAGEVTATLHGLKAAKAARAEFTARFSNRTFGDTQNLPTVSRKEHASAPLVTLLHPDPGLRTEQLRRPPRRRPERPPPHSRGRGRRTAHHSARRGRHPPAALRPRQPG